MPKKNKSKETNQDELGKEIIIGLNSNKKTDNPPKTKNKKQKAKKQKKELQKPKMENKKTKKKKKKKHKLKKILKFLLKVVIIIGIIVGIVLFLFVSPVFSIQEIEVIRSRGNK